MTMNGKNNKKNLEEISSGGGGGVMSVSPSTGEARLRNAIKRSIRLYSSTKKNKNQDNLQEEKIRQVVRSLIKEAKQSSFPKPESTLQGILSKFFNSSGMYETIRDSFYDLQTNEEEKIGFIKHFLERANEVLSMQIADNQPENEELEEAEEAEEQKSREEEILNKWGAFTPNEVGKELEKLKIKKKKNKKDDKQESEDLQVDSFATRGANSARAIFEQRLQDELRKIMLNLIGDEKEQGRISIMQNFAAWFDMWTDDSGQMDEVLKQELEKANVPLPPNWVTSDPGTAADPAAEETSGPDFDTEEEEELLELLNSDLE